MMSIVWLSLRNRNLVWFILLLFVVGGIYSFLNLGKKEDSTFVIKTASVMCRYPGSTPLEVEQLITEPIEREIQTMRNIYKITSESQYGLSMIYVELDPATPPEMIPQLWDELRRKVLNVTPQLPDGASSIVVGDDFGDVYGIYYALSASDGYSFSELRSWAQRLKTRIVAIDGVQKVTLFGEQQPVINIYISLSRLSNFDIRPDAIISTIARQNSVISSGEKSAGEMQIRITEQGNYSSIDDIANQLLISSDGKQYRLGDIARVERDYTEPATSLMRVGGRKAIGIGVSTAANRDVVATGEAITKLLDELTTQMPIGINLEVLYPENRIAREATNTFLFNLMQSIGIVIVVIMFVMGLRAGVLIGSSLLFSIGATLLIMLFLGEGLNRTSLAGFIIAMGMLVDNAIVVVDNAQNYIRQGSSVVNGVVMGAERPKWSLLGATLIAIFSFLPLYLAPSGVAEIIKPLFVVLSVSLLMSWILALTQTPLFGTYLLKAKGKEINYNNRFYRLFDRLLSSFLRHRWSVVGVAMVIFIASIFAMQRLPQSFFPSLDKPYFRADIILPEGWNIDATEQRMAQMERWLSSHKEVQQVSFTAGGSPPRYYLASSAYTLMPNYGNILVEVNTPQQAEVLESKFNSYVRENFPDVWIRSSLFKLSPLPDATIEMGFIGDNIDTLINLCRQANEIMWRNPNATNIRNSWGNKIPSWQPIYSQMKGGRIGISRRELIEGMMVSTTGYVLGEYREGDQLMPILMKDAHLNEFNLSNLTTLPIFSPTGRLFIAQQATSGFELSYNNPVIKRFNRQRVIKAQCDPDRGVNTKVLFAQIKDSVLRRITIPEGYQFRVFGEEETQEESNEALAKNFPLTIILIFITLLLLFGGYKEPFSILLTLPLLLVGVVLSLWISGKMFDFFALLGLLGLIGMNIKNGVVLIDYIAKLRAKGMEPSRAIVEATRSRIIPVVMASGTTILGMIPLLFDSLFGAMAATIMGGLVVATLLTLTLLPTIYALLNRVVLTLAVILLATPLHAQIPVSDYRQEVLDYSQSLKSAEAAIDYATQSVAYSKKSRLPKLSASGNFRYLLRNEQGFKPTGIVVEPTIVQTIYSGGGNNAIIEQAELGRDISLCDAEYTLLEVKYAADYAYWNLWAMERYVSSTEQYVEQISNVRGAIERRYNEGYTTKGDLLMISSQLNEAEYQLISIKQSYLVSLQNFNLLRGFDLTTDADMESIKPDTTAYLERVPIDQAMAARPDYKAAQLSEDQSYAATRQVKSGYNPQLTAGVTGSWYTHSPNYDNSTTLDGFAYLSLSIPIYRFGERRRAVARSKALERASGIAIQSAEDQIIGEEASAWTAIISSYAQQSTAHRSLSIATENLDISTYSYNEGLISIVELMQAQTSWITTFANAIESTMNYQVALANYKKTTGQLWSLHRLQ